MRACIGRFCVEVRTLAFFWVLSNIVAVLSCVMVTKLAKIFIARQKKASKLKNETNKKATDQAANLTFMNDFDWRQRKRELSLR